MLVARLAIRGMVQELIDAGAELNAVDDMGTLLINFAW